MALLLTGILLWTLVHCIPVFAPKIRSKTISKIGIGPYKGLFALSLIGAISLMANGWQDYPEEFYFPQAAGMREISFILIFFAIILFVASSLKTNIKRYLRHPQLNGVMLWAFAHILSNGQAKAILLFSGFIVWAFLMKIGLNKRDGEWGKPDAIRYTHDIKVIAIAAIVYSIILFSHQYFAVSLI